MSTIPIPTEGVKRCGCLKSSCPDCGPWVAEYRKMESEVLSSGAVMELPSGFIPPSDARAVKREPAGTRSGKRELVRKERCEFLGGLIEKETKRCLGTIKFACDHENEEKRTSHPIALPLVNCQTCEDYSPETWTFRGWFSL